MWNFRKKVAEELIGRCANLELGNLVYPVKVELKKVIYTSVPPFVGIVPSIPSVFRKFRVPWAL